MSEERLKILEMLSAGTIDATQAAEMLNAVKAAPETPVAVEVELKAEKSAEPEILKVEVEDDEAAAPAADFKAKYEEKPAATGKKPRWLRIRVMDTVNERRKVNISVPIGLLKFGLNIGRRFSPEIEGFNWDDVDEMVAASEGGLLVDVEDDDEHVQIYVE